MSEIDERTRRAQRRLLFGGHHGVPFKRSLATTALTAPRSVVVATAIARSHQASSVSNSAPAFAPLIEPSLGAPWPPAPTLCADGEPAPLDWAARPEGAPLFGCFRS